MIVLFNLTCGCCFVQLVFSSCSNNFSTHFVGFVVFVHYFYLYVGGQLAKVEKLKPIEANLKRMEDLSASIVRTFALMKDRERDHRDTNGMQLPPREG